jgi:hypothetical protein
MSDERASAYLKFLKLECVESSESYGDEPYIVVEGNKVWGWTPDNEGKPGKVWNLEEEIQNLYGISSQIDVKLMEYDPDTADDLLGQTNPSAEEKDKGAKTIKMTGDGGYYKLTYKVI